MILAAQLIDSTEKMITFQDKPIGVIANIYLGCKVLQPNMIKIWKFVFLASQTVAKQVEHFSLNQERGKCCESRLGLILITHVAGFPIQNYMHGFRVNEVNSPRDLLLIPFQFLIFKTSHS